MSEWVQNGWHDCRTYAIGLHGSAPVSGSWELWCGPAPERRTVAHGPESLPDAHAACDAAAVAWVLIALAKRGAAWAEGIDAELARRYRAAHLAMDAWEFDDARRTTATEQEVDALFAAVTATHAALVRGYL